MWWSTFILFLKITVLVSVEVHFESADSGFFIKHIRQNPLPQELDYQKRIADVGKEYPEYDAVLSLDRFTILETSKPVSIRATYGPFSTKQTVPARNIVPDILANSTEAFNNATAALIELQKSNTRLDISAHVVRPVIYRNSPVLRVLFHTGAEQAGQLQRQNICILLYVSSGKEAPIKSRCVPEGDESVCLAEVIVPSTWWSLSSFPLETHLTNLVLKQPSKHVHVSYSVFEPPSRRSEECEPRIQIQPLTTFVDVVLSQDSASYKEIAPDGHISIFLPNSPLFPLSKFYAPVFLKMSLDKIITTIIIKARIKSGFKLLKVFPSSDFWNVSIDREINKQSFCKLTAVLKTNMFLSKKFDNRTENRDRFGEIFSMLFGVTNETVDSTDGKIVWSVNYVYLQQEQEEPTGNFSNYEVKKKVVAKLEFNKDDIQAILPMAKNWELMNTAILTGRQVAQAMKIFIVSQSGKVADVTLQSSCQAVDESVIKVSSSCSSVYVDGSEIRGSSNASIIIRYGTYTGVAKFIVWMPELPLEVFVADSKLSQIRGWKTPDDSNILTGKKTSKREKRSYIGSRNATNYFVNYNNERFYCKTRYQQTPVEVFAKFIAADQDSGSVSFFISRRTSLRITDLVQPSLRVSDPKIAYLSGRILQGKTIGRTEVQVLSPITGRIIGAKEISVGSDKINVSKLTVRVITGLQLSVSPDNMNGNMFFSETTVTNKLTAQYQEGLLDIDLEFSDGSHTPLREINVNDYTLHVESLDNEVVAFAPMLASHHPRVIAIGEGHGDLLRITMLLSEMCRSRKSLNVIKYVKPSTSILASSLAPVNVVFKTSDSVKKHENIQNDGVTHRDRKLIHHPADLSDITEISGLPYHASDVMKANLKRTHHYHKDKLYRSEIRLKKKQLMTSMEFGMFILLTAFCFAIIVFVISCIVYASKFRKTPIDSDIVVPKELRKVATSNAHDWVWLGRSTMDKSEKLNDVNVFKKNSDHKIRITNNPISNVVETKPLSILDKTEEHQFGTANLHKPPVPPHRQMQPKSHIENFGKHGINGMEKGYRNTNYLKPNISDLKLKLDDQSGKLNTLKFLENLNSTCENGFHFDMDPNDEIKDRERKIQEKCITKIANVSMPKTNGLKKAKIVGNPMFLKNSDMFSDEKFNIDNLDMDYEQILEYFDGLKESNA